MEFLTSRFFTSHSLRLVFCIVLSLSQSACITELLGKYRNSAPAGKADARASARKATRQAIVAIDQGTFRLQLGYDRVWDAMLDVLLRNYNLAIADRNNGLITTEWDSFYVDGKVHRNKLSLRLKRLGTQGTELLVYNNVEVLSKMPDGGITEIWLPTDRNRSEVVRIIQNMALALNLPKPDLPEEPLASGPTPAAPTVEPAASM